VPAYVKAIGFRCGISKKSLDAIVRHAPASVGRGYVELTFADKAKSFAGFHATKASSKRVAPHKRRLKFDHQTSNLGVRGSNPFERAMISMV
jgi:hypothetical protein